MRKRLAPTSRLMLLAAVVALLTGGAPADPPAAPSPDAGGGAAPARPAPTRATGGTSQPSDEVAAMIGECRAALAAGDAAAVVKRLTPRTDALPAEGVLVLAAALEQCGRSADGVLTAAHARLPDNREVAAAWVAAARRAGQPATALTRVLGLPPAWRTVPDFQLEAAQAYFALGNLLGQAQVRTVPEGKAGQFAGAWLLVEPRPGRDAFLCSPPESALYAVRAALDAGLDTPATHLLHARIWQRLGRPETALRVLNNRATLLLADADADTLQTFAELSLATGDVGEFLKYERRRAGLLSEQRDGVLAEAFLALAEHYSQKGDDALYRQWLCRAARLRPDDPALLLRLADGEWQGGAADAEAAARHYRRVLELRPDHPERKRIMERLATRPVKP